MAAPPKPAPSVVTGLPPAEDAEKLNVVETPTSPSSGLALSRFEFETGKGNEGTKILMVDWDPSAAARGPQGGSTSISEADIGDPSADWEVSWEGKTTVLPIRDSDSSEGGANRRVYFLLPPGAPIPPLVTISKGKAVAALHTKPMPAIFHPGLGVESRDVGTRGVLHTIWAKKRLSELQAEADREMKANGESVGLEMALQERQWIIEHFGLPIPVVGAASRAPPTTPISPTQPRSPIIGRLGEKLKGLRLATSPTDLAAASQAARQAQISSLSPQAADVAVSSYSMFHERSAHGAAAENAGVASLDAIIGGGPGAAVVGGGPVGSLKDADTEEDLFALPMSPRSPEMKRSPFSML
ncbi:hypothetical protein GGTG_01264 [Gaeumannomyces tritici R3-111a-1]|uniref:Uncharacterized protein n=1 Tax=Gaeumannomyces tritici (strain R3-111a-1) TaxID=644352 RepID=J3NJ30_GAET3|nr:hypothetical protein GGTG_01264 [Gaeumannomyces tritici R3-111a-1]EJT81280.1 hypothetical protein GGTG_01264 [Gaeumannomyces tritici R3-111a-1]